MLAQRISFIKPACQILRFFSLILHAQHVPSAQKLSEFTIRWLNRSYFRLIASLTIPLLPFYHFFFVSIIQNLISIDYRYWFKILKVRMMRHRQLKKSWSSSFLVLSMRVTAVKQRYFSGYYFKVGIIVTGSGNTWLSIPRCNYLIANVSLFTKMCCTLSLLSKCHPTAWNSSVH